MNSKKSKRLSVSNRCVFEIAVVAILIVLGIASRFWLADFPNFKPVAAMALLMGAVFHYRRLAFAAPLVIMLISDLAFGFYQWPVVFAVYGSMMVAVAMGMILGSSLERSKRPSERCGWIGAASVLISLQFFMVTNAAVCLTGWYPVSISGLSQSYAAGLPFLKYTLLGDLMFSLGLFSVYYAGQACVERVRPTYRRILVAYAVADSQ